MLLRFKPGLCLAFVFAIAVPLFAVSSSAQDSTTNQPKRGRKYKAPPDTSHIEVTVLKDSNGKPLLNAAVIFHSVKDGLDEGNLEVKTNEDGKAVIDVIPTGSNVAVQVIAEGYSSFAADYVVNEAARAIEIRLLKPGTQVSTYSDTGRAPQQPVGVQEPATKATLPGTGQPLPTRPNSTTTTPTVPPPATPATPPPHSL
jgi:hypothetical protein